MFQIERRTPFLIGAIGFQPVKPILIGNDLEWHFHSATAHEHRAQDLMPSDDRLNSETQTVRIHWSLQGYRETRMPAVQTLALGQDRFLLCGKPKRGHTSVRRCRHGQPWLI